MSRVFYPYPTREELVEIDPAPLPGARVSAVMLKQNMLTCKGARHLQREPLSPLMSCVLFCGGCAILFLMIMIALP